ncbi:hypothetical protein [Rickettsiales endosymbiont of Stachyamoeba lipophora]|uniref:hypothetical protein n=1 Tax=Rickettsiales endosymbiont of Stachyamoeba lipophora TaxID=2486578 RepID=UPI000F6500FD|nr:hypothetical protein [Rickettsiales endosymbiont of Stachyamoeba lipophora]AZL15541.1 hypothetical protein EF513_03110 [Rickettsiales endosymbiont of Stachyamoeba lipophora]
MSKNVNNKNEFWEPVLIAAKNFADKASDNDYSWFKKFANLLASLGMQIKPEIIKNPTTDHSKVSPTDSEEK